MNLTKNMLSRTASLVAEIQAHCVGTTYPCSPKNTKKIIIKNCSQEIFSGGAGFTKFMPIVHQLFSKVTTTGG